MNPLGRCKRCRGDLCTGTVTQELPDGTVTRTPGVKCEQCGESVPDHPVLKVPAEGVALPPRSRTIPPQEYAHTWLDRIVDLEKLTRRQSEQIVTLEKRLAALETKAGRQKAAA